MMSEISSISSNGVLSKKKGENNMITRNQSTTPQRKWTPQKTVSHRGQDLVLHRWKQETLEKDTNVLLTEDDLHYFPSQKELKENNYYAHKDVYDKLYKPLFNIQEVDKVGRVKVVGNKLNLIESSC